MSRELRCTYNGAGQALYVIIRRRNDDKVWNTANAAFETWADGTIADYDIPLSDEGGDSYAADWPTAITAGQYQTFYYLRAGATPATTDLPLKSPYLTWNGYVASSGGGGGSAEGYYVKRERVLELAGQDNFDAEGNLDSNAIVADETVVQNIFDLGDRFVDSRAFILGVTKDSGATSPHYLATTNAAFDFISDWASRWARAQLYLIRGVTGSEDAAKAEGQMRDMRDEAETRIDELLILVLNGQIVDAGSDGAKVYTSYHPCWPCAPYGWPGW